MASNGRSRAPVVDRSVRDGAIIEQYQSGAPVESIAERNGVCVKTVRNVARRAGLAPRNLPQPDRDAAAVALYRAGLRVEEISRRLGIGRSRVRLVSAKAGVPPREKWQRRYPIDETVFDHPTDVGWWLIGLLAADGSILKHENRVSLCQKTADIDVLRAFYEYVGCPDRPLTMLNLSEEARARQLPRGPAAEARVFSRRIVDALGRHGVLPGKTASLELSPEACKQRAVWLGLLDGDGSVGIYRAGRQPRVSFYGTRRLMKQCEDFWRKTIPFASARPTARYHARGIWGFQVHCAKAVAVARMLLEASPVSMARKRGLLVEIAGWLPKRGL